MDRTGALLDHFGLQATSLPPAAGTCAGTLIVAGSGRSIWSDLSAIEDAPRTDAIAVNDCIIHYPFALKHAYSNAAERLAHWLGCRREDLQRRDGRPPEAHHCREGRHDGTFWPWPGHGTSGLNAVYTAIALGYSRILVAGMPLDNTGHYFDPPWRGNPDYKSERRYWLSVADILRGVVFGVSGWLAQEFSFT